MELCSQVEGEPFRPPFKIVMKKVGVPPITEGMEPEAVGRITEHLSPQLPTLVVTSREIEEGPPLLAATEIDAAIDRVCDKARKNIQQFVDHHTSG